MKYACLSLILAAGLAACSSDDKSDPPPGGCAEYQVPASTDLTTPQVSFANDVLPIFAQTCSSPSCHGAQSGDNNGIFLGTRSGPNDAAQIRAALVGKRAPKTTDMNFVTAGDPKESFLMRKLDGDQCKLTARCEGGDCGALMPNGVTTPMDVARRDTIRRWIAQGAKDN